jgi:rhamnopyranosyl-N-acetylglucosaminyl-diphospho-decaprenol beta-1,3/1,4-galactofuranosyltransferase
VAETSPASAARIIAVVVTRDRPALLRRCLSAILLQSPRGPDAVLVVDNASGPETVRVLAEFPTVRVLRQEVNLGGAGGYRAGMEAALRDGADWVWAMDDDGRPRDARCLTDLLEAATRRRALLAAPLVLDADAPERLAFPLRLGGRTRFAVEALGDCGEVHGQAHLFNGALIAARLLFSVGLPDPRFVVRGDEVDFLYRARRWAGPEAVVLVPRCAFLHPGNRAEIHPILGGAYYATLPLDLRKQFYQFRNRAWIFRRHGMWLWLAADLVRYGCFWLLTRRDPAGLRRWAAASWEGLRGRFMREGGTLGHLAAPAALSRLGSEPAAPSALGDGQLMGRRRPSG